MDYYNEIKKELIDNEIYKRVKDYSKNRYELESPNKNNINIYLNAEKEAVIA